MVQGRGRSPPECADIMKDYAARLWIREYAGFSTDSLTIHDMVIYIPNQQIPLEALLGCSSVTGRDPYRAVG